MNKVSMMGDISLWQLPKTAFLCSDKFSAGSVLKSYDWAIEMKRANRCVISGFQSKLESDVFELLLKGNSPLIWVLARGMFDRAPLKLREHIESGRLLIVSPFDQAIKRPNRELAYERNQFIADNADEVVFAHIHVGGMLEQLVIGDGNTTRFLDGE
ncbi:MAG: DNA-binding protein [Firmicutes bacterium]|nr:DNA-binding protein [Bacillota bacterium]